MMGPDYIQNRRCRAHVQPAPASPTPHATAQLFDTPHFALYTTAAAAAGEWLWKRPPDWRATPEPSVTPLQARPDQLASPVTPPYHEAVSASAKPHTEELQRMLINDRLSQLLRQHLDVREDIPDGAEFEVAVLKG